MYSCQKCELKVIVLDGQVIKACKCEAPIAAELKVDLKGIGGLDDNK
jgi:hypothetical protein